MKHDHFSIFRNHFLKGEWLGNAIRTLLIEFGAETFQLLIERVISCCGIFHAIAQLRQGYLRSTHHGSCIYTISKFPRKLPITGKFVEGSACDCFIARLVVRSMQQVLENKPCEAYLSQGTCNNIKSISYKIKNTKLQDS